MNEKYVKVLLKLANKASKKNEVPVAAIMVKNNKIVAKSYNKRNKLNNPLLHAEVQCIVKTAKKNKDWRLDDYILYSTLEPCHMCKEIIKECRIKKTYYILKNNKKVNYKQTISKIDCCQTLEYELLLKNFFKKIRK